MDKLIFNPDKIGKTDISNLQTALTKLRLPIAQNEMGETRIGESTIKAIKNIQQKHGLPATGQVNDGTLKVLNGELFDAHYALNKTRTDRIHELLEKNGLTIKPDERQSRIVGEATRQAIKKFQEQAGLPADGKVTEAFLEKLNNEAIKKTYSTKTQIGKLQQTILRAVKIAKLPDSISSAELKEKTIGATTTNAIMSLQSKYNLPKTGQLDKATLDKIQSIAASRGTREEMMRKPQAVTLSLINKNLRLNKVSPQVAELQKALAHLGYSIADNEFKTQTFGKTTREAVLAFQEKNGLPETGHVENGTRKSINRMIETANPDATASKSKYKVKGSVRDEVMQPKGNMVIQVFEKLLDGESKEPLASQRNYMNGFFDISYTPPIDSRTGKVKEKIHLIVKLLDEKNQVIDSPRIVYNVSPIQWVNFNLGGTPYQGETEYSAILSILQAALEGKRITDIKETADNRQVTQLSKETGLGMDDIMRLILSHRVAAGINRPIITAELIYAFIRQNVPASLPADLLRGANDWETIQQLTETAESGIVFSEDSLLAQTLDHALLQNVVSPVLKQKKDAILEEFASLRNSFTLKKPILIGDGNLESLLKLSKIPADKYGTVADAFIASNGINQEFWNELSEKNAELGKGVQDFAATVDLGSITKNHMPMVKFLKSQMAAQPETYKLASDMAKLDHGEWIKLINAGGKSVPADMPGTDIDKKVASYAAVLKSRAENLFPEVALVATVKRGKNHKLQKLDTIEKFIDQQTDFNLKQDNLDKYLYDHPTIQLDKKVIEETKVIQRVHKLTADSASGKALLEEGLHSASQVYFTGKKRLMRMLENYGVEEKHASAVYEQSKTRYMQILTRLLEFRKEFQAGSPEAIASQTYTKEDIIGAIGDIPNLETLFGSLDFCQCEQCQSLYSPAAYLTDLLRFLNEHDSLITRNGRVLTVKDILFDRRPDLGNIKLNCANTNTPMPYIDLVCEILENNINPVEKNFSYQTTASDKEIRAIPQYVHPDAYSTLAKADFPMHSSFNLWQEEARTYLDYLRVPRFELMEAFQDHSDSASAVTREASIASEYFGSSSHEAMVITSTINTSQPAGMDELQKYWGEKGKCWSKTQPEFEGINIALKEIPVKLFLNRLKLSYNELLELLQVKFLNEPDQTVLQRPSDSCSLDVQMVTNLSPVKFDKIHRFIRLWRKTGWNMWELDLLIRNPKVGGNQINRQTLANLKRFKQLQEKLGLPFEIVLAFYGNINAEQRTMPENPGWKIQPLYHQIFLNKAIIHPPDDHFKLDPGVPERIEQLKLLHEPLSFEAAGGYTPVPSILSALAIRQADFDTLRTKTNNHLSMASLSTLLRYTYLARSMKLSVKDLWLLLAITGTTDPFNSLQSTLDFIKSYDALKSSGLPLAELHYVLTFSPASPAGLRRETISQLIDGLRKILADNEKTIAKLNLDETNRNLMIAFNTFALEGMADAELLLKIKPLQDALKAVGDGFKQAKFAVDESEFIKSFKSHPDFKKDALVENIKKLQGDLSDLFAQNRNQIVAHMASSFGVTDQHAKFILNQDFTGQTKTLLDILTDPSLLQKKPDGSYPDINEANYGIHFKVYSLIHKISLLIQRLKIEAADLEYFQKNHASFDTLDLIHLPVDAKAQPGRFKSWLNLFKFLDFKSKYPEPEDVSLRDILNMAKDGATTIANLHKQLQKLTQWDEGDLAALGTGLNFKKEDYKSAELYFRLQTCFSQMNVTGVNAAAMMRWAKRDEEALQQDAAREIRLAVKAKYEKEDWLEKMTPLQDALREKKRQALVAYLLEKSQRTQSPKERVGVREMPNPLYWRDPIALFKYFLIDVEMSSCQLTSRIKQAISSIQLFVQRCFLNLENRYVQVSQAEKEDTTSENAWPQWKWMKNYRIWEANRKVFFYPENWIEPELRDDKTPFFEELENEIMQNEITHENVELAFLNYLYKVDEVSRLEVCGLYHEMEELNPHELGYEINNVHVIARTKSIPHIYYYRKYDMNYAAWSAWEKIEADIQGDHVVPVIYNRKLHLFWLVFTEKPQKTNKIPPAEASPKPTDAPEQQKVLELQLAWSVKRQNGWSTKKISASKLIHPWERPHFSYNLKPYYKSAANELWLDIYLSTSKEFNERKFYDPFVHNHAKVTAAHFNETYLPWHSASFVFDGDVKAVKLKALSGQYHLSGPGRKVDDAVLTNSFVYVQENFGEDGAKITKLFPGEVRRQLTLPNGMHFRHNRLTNNRVHSINNNELRVLENYKTTTLLKGAINPFELVMTQQDLQLNTLENDHPFFYQDNERAFFIKPEWQLIFAGRGYIVNRTRKYRTLPFYHPYTALFIRELNRSGLDGLLNRKIQMEPKKPSAAFSFNKYQPVSIVSADETVKTEQVDFTFGGAYSVYNWEIFFHAPMMIACRLSQNQRFEEAMRWFHYIFDPTNIDCKSVPERYWITKPFYEMNKDEYRKQRIETIISNLDIKENKGQLIAWRNHPFQPHLIARYRPVAYQRNVLMKYLDNLIAWADHLFLRDTMESINEATLLYMLAYELLGGRPEKVPNIKHEDLSFNELENKLDALGNARVDVLIEDTLQPVEVVPALDGAVPLPNIDTFYFCIPNNENLLKYWDIVEDRLFKIRHCMNMQGIVRQLPLFEPPIDPALLVKAAAAGMDLSSVMNDARVGTPNYRFRVMIQKAVELCNDVRNLGEKLLAALEKKDAESLALLRSQHEIQLLGAIKEIKKKQVDEAVESLGGLNKAKEMADEKKSFYEGREFMNALEIGSAALSGGSILLSGILSISEMIAGLFHMLPSFNIGISGFGGSPEATVQWGSENIAKSMQAQNSALQHVGSMLSQSSSLIGTIAGYQRRKDEWDFQGRLAAIESDQLQFQINAAQIRMAIAEKDLDNQELQMANAEAVDEYMRNKYTNEQLYNWMISQISKVYFQAYQLAYDMAKKAEKCYQYELGIKDSSFIQFGHWDSLKKGLLSGDKLIQDLRRLEAAYMDENKRELEITKHISLAQVDPLSLMRLKETGKCVISLPEWLFNMDYPGHYMRRIKSISVSIPCVAGPYTSINCSLSLLKNEIRMEGALLGGKYEKTADDPRFKTQWGAISSIATSHGQNDSGMFELNFNDERYLPFEGAGVISEWELNMPKENNYFDFATISDLILHVNYTARDGGSRLAIEGNKELQQILPNACMKLFSLKRDFPTEWNKFFHPAGGADQELTINPKPEHYPFFLRGKINSLKISRLELYIDSKSDVKFEGVIKAGDTNYEANPSAFSPHSEIGRPYTFRDYSAAGSKPAALDEVRMKIRAKAVPPSASPDFKSLKPEDIDDLFLLCYISGNPV